MQKTVTLSLTRSTDSETDGHAGVITVPLRCGESVVKLTIRGHIMFKPSYVDIILSYWTYSLSLADGRR